MDTSQLKNYAPEARRAFIAAVSAQAALLGITAKGIEDARVKGDVLLVGGQAFPKALAAPRKRLAERVETHGFEATMEAVAYTWFNRFVAIRYMELHGYLEHGYRVLSHPEGEGRPEILDHAADVDLAGLDSARVVELKLDGTKDEELYRLLLTAQCNGLHKAMPFLFERIGDETELLLPANLLHSDSLIRKLVESIDEDAWEQIEIIGWIYQFYISEKKDQVIGKVVKSEDIPAATQLFTPNWIVKYMVQNSLGAQWLATYPNSPLKEKMEFYIEPAAQTEEVQAQLDAITPKSLNPEELTLIDPACGSGHILVEAYDLFKAIYLERGHRLRDVPKLILEKNLFGLDIDKRAAQLAGFALTMKGRADDRRLFERETKLNVLALVDSGGGDAKRLANGMRLDDHGVEPMDLADLERLFEHARTLGSLIQVPERVVAKLPMLRRLSEASSQDLFESEALKRVRPLVRQAELLTAHYDAVVATPPYMGSKGMNGFVKKFVKDYFAESKSDLFAVSSDRFSRFAKPSGFVGLMTPFTWMFLKSYEALRGLLLETKTLQSLIQPEYHAFFDSAFVPVCAFVVQACRTSGYDASFIRLADFYGAALQAPKAREAIRNPDCGWLYRAKPDEFKKIPGSPVAYWVSDRVREVFSTADSLGTVGSPTHGVVTGNNDRFLKTWSEVSLSNTCFTAVSREEAVGSKARWFPVSKGGAFRRWFGNNEFVIDWLDDGHELRTTKHDTGRIRATNFNLGRIFQPGITWWVGGWSTISSGALSMRYLPEGMIFESKGSVCFSDEEEQRLFLLALTNTHVIAELLLSVSPTLDYHEGPMSRLPIVSLKTTRPLRIAELCRAAARVDWDAFERSWNFQSIPILAAPSDRPGVLESSYTAWLSQNRETIVEMRNLEGENNRLFIDAYGLADELTPEVPIEQITLTVNPAYRYGGKLTDEEQWTRFRQDTMEELVSHAIGCMMGRYSLDEPGLIYAHSGNIDFDSTRYVIFPADDDGIIPLTDTHWFDDDACHRLIDFIQIAWDEAHLEENLTFLANSLSPKKSESSRETLRRYLNTTFFKDHLKTYKKHPIYWLFSSGKQKAFQALVYPHRYNEATLSRMRSEYAIPLQGKIAARLEKLATDIQGATSTAQGKRLSKEKAKLEKQQVELLAFDEKLRHYADRRIALDLDDGVKVNYGKFGNLLAEVKAVHGKKPEAA